MTELVQETDTAALDLGVVIDNSETAIEYRSCFSDRDEAEARLESCTAKVREIETEPCKITAQFTDVDKGVELRARYEFCCAAEKLIFEMRCQSCCV